MCLVTTLEPGVMPDEEALRAGVLANGDGSGFAIWNRPGEFIHFRSANGLAALYGFMVARKTWPDGPAIFASRWQTTGDLGESNISPFAVSLNSGPAMFAHNGHLPEVVHQSGQETWSDSRILAHELELNGKVTFLQDMSAHLKLHHNKVALITARSGLHHIGDWDPALRFGGIWYSSVDYIAPPEPDGAEPDLHRVKFLYRELAAQYGQGDKEAGQRMVALRHLVPMIDRH